MFGECPQWYPTIRAARYLKVPPWELAQKSHVWVEWALTAEDAEAQAQQRRQQRSQQIQKAKRSS